MHGLGSHFVPIPLNTFPVEGRHSHGGVSEQFSPSQHAPTTLDDLQDLPTPKNTIPGSAHLHCGLTSHWLPWQQAPSWQAPKQPSSDPHRDLPSPETPAGRLFDS